MADADLITIRVPLTFQLETNTALGGALLLALEAVPSAESVEAIKVIEVVAAKLLGIATIERARRGIRSG